MAAITAERSQSSRPNSRAGDRLLGGKQAIALSGRHRARPDAIEGRGCRADRGGHSGKLSRAQALADQFGLQRDGAILSGGNIALDPRKLTAGLLLKALKRKARAYAPVETTSITSSGDEVAIATKAGPTITAKQVVLATGYELTDVVPAENHSIISTWALATRPQKPALWPGEAIIWEASDPYLYLRATPDGRVICGGEDEEFTDEEQRDGLLAAKSARLSAKLKTLFPDIDTTPEFAWTASFGTTTTGLPYIGAVPRHPRIHAVMGYGGNGITYSQLASEIISASLRGRDDADAKLFAFNR